MLGKVVIGPKAQSALAAPRAHAARPTSSFASGQRMVRATGSHRKFPAGVMAGDAESYKVGDAWRARAVLWTKYRGNRHQHLTAHIRKKGDRHFRQIDDTKVDKNPVDE